MEVGKLLAVSFSKHFPYFHLILHKQMTVHLNDITRENCLMNLSTVTHKFKHLSLFNTRVWLPRVGFNVTVPSVHLGTAHPQLI
jgi:hypothetical protein